MSFWALWTTWSGFGACDVSCLGETGERSRQRIQTCPVKVDNCDAAKVEVEYYECEGMDPPGKTLTSCVDPPGKTLTCVDPPGKTLTSCVDPPGKTLTCVDPQGKTLTSCVDPPGKTLTSC